MKSKADRLGQSRYSAMLLFQFRVVVGGKSSIMRTCEKRLIVFSANSAKAALAWAKRRGRSSEHSYKNNDGNPVYFEFVGVMDLLSIGAECEEDEVWYDIISLKRPMERANKLLPPEHKLNAMRGQALTSRSTRSRAKTRAPG